MTTNQMTNEAATAVSIIDNIEGKDVQAVTTEKNKIVISQNSRIIAQWTGETWILGTILESVLPMYEDNCIHVINACTRLYRRNVDYKKSVTQDACSTHSLRMIKFHMDTVGINSIKFSGSLSNVWSPSISYMILRQEAKGAIGENKQEMFQLWKLNKGSVVSKADYGFGTSLIGWINVKSNRVTLASNIANYMKKWSLNGNKEVIKDDVIRQILEYNNTKKK
jgi:hypothetical protein